MTLPEAFDAIRVAGAILLLDDQGPLLKGRVPDPVVATLRAHRDRVVAILELRQVHRCMGLSEEDVLFVESALLSGKVNEIRVVCRPPSGAAA